MASWADLENELAKWHSNGATATLWWRDDDACVLTPQLRQLVEIADTAKVPLHLAVIPARLEPQATKLLSQSPNTWILQHGFSHKDYAPKGQGSWELGDHRPLAVVLSELKDGFDSLKEAFPEKFLPVLVPPWTRISDQVKENLSLVGLTAYSAEGCRAMDKNDSDVKVIHAHCDPIKWKNNAAFKGHERVIDDFVQHLTQRRTGKCDPSEPTGLCTHHMDHSTQLWQFLPEFFNKTKAMPAASWISLEKELA